MSRKITKLSGPDAGTTVEVPEQSIGEAAASLFGHGPVSGNSDEEKQLATENSDTPSNAGKQAQSTDHQNSY